MLGEGTLAKHDSEPVTVLSLQILQRWPKNEARHALEIAELLDDESRIARTANMRRFGAWRSVHR